MKIEKFVELPEHVQEKVLKDIEVTYLGVIPINVEGEEEHVHRIAFTFNGPIPKKMNGDKILLEHWVTKEVL